jgi:hypothetical protein
MSRHLPALLTAAAILVGWLLVTWALAGWWSWRVWPLSLGLLCLSAAGWKLILHVAREGLYLLAKD